MRAFALMAALLIAGVAAAQTDTPTSTSTSTPTATPTQTLTPFPPDEPFGDGTGVPTKTPTPGNTATRTVTATRTATPTITVTPSPRAGYRVNPATMDAEVLGKLVVPGGIMELCILTSDPELVEGALWYNRVDHQLCYYHGGAKLCADFVIQGL